MSSKITTYAKTSRSPIPYGALFPGSLFVIYAEKSRGQNYSKDNTVYQRSNNGFYSETTDGTDRAIVLYPEDLVWPLKKKAQES